MTFDRRPDAQKTAAGKSFATYLNDAQVEFLKEVRKELLKGAIPDMSYDLHNSPPHIIFEGEIEAGEMTVGSIYMAFQGGDVVVHIKMSHPRLGNKQDAVRSKAAQMTPALVASGVLAFIQRA